MSLGVLRVAAAVEDVCDVQVFEPRGEHEMDKLGSNYSHVYAFTATTPQMPYVMYMAKHEWLADSVKVIGGPHVTMVKASMDAGSTRAALLWEELKGVFDVIVVGDGEIAMRSLIEKLGGKPTRSDRAGIPQVWDADDPKSEHWVKDLDSLPFPDRSLVDVDSYHFEIEGERAMSLVSQLGCPFNCGFCGGRSSASFRRIRRRSTQSVIKEMRHLYDTYKVKGFMFYDDELNVNKSLDELCHAIQDLQSDLGVDFKLRGFIKAELFSDEQAELMSHTGFVSLLCGFESGDEKILRNINKKATKDDNTRVVERCSRNGIKIKALMSLGHPGENTSTYIITSRWVEDVKPDDVDVALITPYPGSPYYDKAEWNGDCWVYEVNGDKQYQLPVDFHSDMSFYKGVPGSYRSTVATDYVNAKELVEMRDDMERSFRSTLNLPPLPPHQRAFESSMGQ